MSYNLSTTLASPNSVFGAFECSAFTLNRLELAVQFFLPSLGCPVKGYVPPHPFGGFSLLTQHRSRYFRQIFEMKNLVVFPIIFCLIAFLNNSHCDVLKKPCKTNGRTTFIGTVAHTLEGNNNPGRPFCAFRGIPYAEAPIGKNRWTDLKLQQLPESDFDATKFGSHCPIYSKAEKKVYGNEDCLFINVYTPTSQEGADSTKLPVLFYIHGGGYVVGSSTLIGPDIFLNHDVVLVTFNYRLGALGYLSSGHKNLPGNYGALDQVLALDWVRKHISSFGGDPGNILVFGHSAGGASTHMFTMSPKTKGKYDKAIIQSGTGLSIMAVDNNPQKYFEDFVSRSGCTHDISSPALTECLKFKTIEELMELQWETIDYWVLPITSKHVVDRDTRGPDNAFLSDTPANLMSKGQYHDTPIMTGITQDEGVMGYTFLHLDQLGKFDDIDYFKATIIPKMMKSFVPFGSTEKYITFLTKEVLNYYFPKDEYLEDRNLRISRVSDIIGDSLLNSGHWDLLKKYSEHGKESSKIYSYIFTHRTKESPSSIWKQVEELRRNNVDHELFDSAVAHVDDMYYAFSPNLQVPPKPNQTLSSEDIEFAHYLTGIFVAFAKDGTPANGINTSDGFPEWKPIEYSSVNYYNLTSVPVPMGSEFRREILRCCNNCNAISTLIPRRNNVAKNEVGIKLSTCCSATLFLRGINVDIALQLLQQRRIYGVIVESTLIPLEFHGQKSTASQQSKMFTGKESKFWIRVFGYLDANKAKEKDEL